MNKRQKKKREKLHDFGHSSWKDKRRMDKSYRDFLRLTQHSQKAMPKFDIWF
jgi:hypothetical protein